MKIHLLALLLFFSAQAAFSQEPELQRLLEQKVLIEQEITHLQDSLEQVESKIRSLQGRQNSASLTQDSNPVIEKEEPTELTISLDELLNENNSDASSLARKDSLRNEIALSRSEGLGEFTEESEPRSVGSEAAEVKEEKKAPAITLRRNELLAKENLSIRVRPDSDSQIILELEKNSIVWKIDEIGEYTLVCYEGTCGYVPATSVGKSVEPDL